MSKITLTGKYVTLKQIAAICRDHAEVDWQKKAQTEHSGIQKSSR